VTISSCLNFGHPAPLGMGSVAGRNFLALPYYSQRAVFASLLSAFSFPIVYPDLFCRGVYITDSVVSRSRYMVGLCYPSIADNADFDFLTFLKIVNCDFTQTFTINSMHRYGSHIKIWQMENSCNSKKIRLKKNRFSLSSFLENSVEFLHSVCARLRRSGALRNGCKKLGIFLKLFRQRAPD